MLIGVIAAGTLSDFISKRRILSTQHSRYGSITNLNAWCKIAFYSRNFLTFRKVFHAFGLASTTIGCISLSFVGCNQTLVIVILVISTGLNGFTYSGYAVSWLKNIIYKIHKVIRKFLQLNHMDLSPNYSGTLMGITNTMSSVTGFITPITSGNVSNSKTFIFQSQYSSFFFSQQTFAAWRTVFLITSCVTGVTGLQFVLLAVGEVQPWNTYWKTEAEDSLKDIDKAWYEALMSLCTRDCVVQNPIYEMHMLKMRRLKK